MICEKCGKEIDVIYGSGRFCSRECANSRDNSGKYIDRKCVDCGKDVSVVNTMPIQFVKCSECINPKKEKIVKSKQQCKNCGNEVSKISSIFCSTQCSADFKFKESCEKIIKSNGIGFDSRALKRFLLYKYGNKCSICGMHEWMGKEIPIVIDHINGRASENNLDNVRLVCANCDAQLPTYKSKNKNSDRKRSGKYI